MKQTRRVLREFKTGREMDALRRICREVSVLIRSGDMDALREYTDEFDETHSFSELRMLLCELKPVSNVPWFRERMDEIHAVLEARIEAKIW